MMRLRSLRREHRTTRRLLLLLEERRRVEVLARAEEDQVVDMAS